MDFDLTFSGDVERSFSAHFPITDLSMWHVEESHDLAGTLVDRVSTILSGSLFLSALEDREYKLRSGQPLEFTQPSGILRKLSLADGKISLRFEGAVHGIRTGAGEGFRSLMPTYLEWARARHGVTLLWGSAIYIFGLAMAVLRWLEIVK
jgi:hypothetical protein